MRSPDAPARMRRFLEQGGQTREVELRLGAVCEELTEPRRP